MNEFFKSIYTHFTELIEAVHNDFYLGIGGRLYYGQAPQECAKPYAVFFGVSSVPDDTFSEMIDDISIQFNIYSNLFSYTEAGSIQKKCRALYDGVTLEVVGSRDIILRRSLSIPAWKENEDTWITSIEFENLIQEG